ncbi:outer membrane protein assembly factor BamB [Motiliproteus sediminis]|uniref:outer membrane protein assembly factor BamB n=1 Tax=Motiliproteus sediminis TaxID=1468178 RepID=UPI001AEF62D1|nr:outer membrane protein assembly factor BamB [Motiliproteus sediminis]
MRSRAVLAVLLSLLVMLGGCSAVSDGEEVEPAALVSFDEEFDVQELWSSQLAGGLGDKYQQYRPAFLGNRIYSISADGRLAAADVERGTRLWRVDIDTAIAGGVAAGDGKLAVTSYDGRLLVFSALDGAAQWQTPLSSEAVAPAAIGGGLVLVQTIDGRLVAFNAETGERQWSYTAQKPSLTLRGTSRPLILGDLVYAGFANGKVVSLRLASGEMVWESRVTVPTGQTELERMVDIDGDLVAGNGVLYATTYQGRVATIAMRDGRVLWGRELSSYRGVAESDEQLFAVDAEGRVLGYDKVSSTELWLQEGLYFRQPTAPVYYKGAVVLADFEGYLHFLSPQDGRFIARERVDSAGVAAPLAVRDGVLYVLGNSGRVTALTIDG